MPGTGQLTAHDPIHFSDPIPALQKVSGADFGLKWQHTREEREAALRKARRWIAKNAPVR